MKTNKTIALFLLATFILAGCGGVVSAAAYLPDPQIDTTTSTPTSTPTAVPTLQPIAATPAPIDPPATAGGKQLGWAGQIQCYDCAPFTVNVRLTNYDPNQGDINCWEYSEDFNWCMSETYSGIPWESVYGLAAACPAEWMIGTWVDIPGVGAFICLDHGGAIVCDYENNVCNVDLLGAAREEWNGKTFTATLWVPLKPRR